MALRVKANIASVRIKPIQDLTRATFAVEYEIESSVDAGPIKRDSFLLDKAGITGSTTLDQLRAAIVDQIKAREGIA